MSPPSKTTMPLEIAPSTNRSRALWLLFSESAAEHRVGQVAATLSSAGQGQLSLEGLLEARRGGSIVGASWGQVMPGRTALMWAAQLVSSESESTAMRLHEAIERRFEAHGVCLAQASLPDKPTLSEARLRSSGFRHLADICYLASPLDDLNEFCADQDATVDAQGGASELTFETYQAANHARLAEIVERTYQQSLDCPALDGLRNMEDVLEGYRHTGEFQPQRWMIVRHGGRDVGCLLLADHPQQQQWELVYMGLLPECRGRRWGLAVTRHAQRLAAAAGRARLVLAVDAKNTPALAMYHAAGLVTWDRRRVLLKVLRPIS